MKSPDQHKGNDLNVEHSVTIGDLTQAHALFKMAAERLLNVNAWHTLTQPKLAVFQLTDAQGNELSRHARDGDLLRINIPAPGSLNGEGFEWVAVEKFETISREDFEEVAMQARPVPSPVHPHEGTAHFFKHDASSTFKVFRKDLTVTAGIYGRNEVANTESTNLIDKIRNIAVATGAVLAGSHLQWKRLAEGLIGQNEPIK